MARTATLTNGPIVLVIDLDDDCEGTTLLDVLNAATSAQIAPGASVNLNGDSVSPDAFGDVEVEEGATIDVAKPTGSKG